MKVELPIHIKILETISIHIITPLFTESLIDIIKNISSSSSTKSFSDKELQAYLYSAIQTIHNTCYLIP